HFLSLYQSAVAEIAAGAAAQGTGSSLEAVSKSDAADLVLAAERTARLHATVRAVGHPVAAEAATDTSLEKMAPADQAATCAALGWDLMQAKVAGDTATAKRIEQELVAGTCDPRWAETITKYLDYFGPFGSRREPVYIAPQSVGKKVIIIKAGARIGIVG